MECTQLLKSAGIELVVLDCPYADWQNLEVREVFNRVVSLKLTGYLNDYPFGITPIDTTDFVGTHYLFGRRTPYGFQPIMGYKSISYKRCQDFNLTFPALAICQVSGAEYQAKAIQDFISSRNEAGDFAYDSSWTILPEYRKDRELTQALKQLFYGINYIHHHENKVNTLFGMGMLRFKTEKFFQSVGYHLVRPDKNTEAQAFNMATLKGEPAYLLRLNQFSDICRKNAETYKEFWEKRKTLGKDPSTHASIHLLKAA